MRASAVDRVSQTSSSRDHLLRLVLEPSPLGTAKFALMTLPALICTIAVLALAIGLAINAPEAVRVFTERPATAVPLAIGLTLLISFVWFPARVLLQKIGHKTIVEIDTHEVRVHQHDLVSAETWTESLMNFSGIATRTRTSISGTIQELMLVHPNPSKSLLLSLEPVRGAISAAHWSNLLGLPIIDLTNIQQDRAPPAIPSAIPATSDELTASAA